MARGPRTPATGALSGHAEVVIGREFPIEVVDLQSAVTRGAEPAAPPKRHRSTGFDKLPGRRPMKEYPLTESDLFSLGLLQGGSSLTLAASGACLGAWTSIKQAVQFAGKDISA